MLLREFRGDPAYHPVYRAASRKHSFGIAAYPVTMPFAYVHSYIPVAAVLPVAAACFLPAPP